MDANPSTLVVATAISRTLTSCVLDLARRGKSPTLLTTSDEAHQIFSRLGLTPIALPYTPAQSIAESDTQFSEWFLPGPYLDFPFPTTHLHLWKVFSIDRLRFWNQTERVLSLAESIRAAHCDQLVVSLNLHDPLCLAISNSQTIAVQADSLLTREAYDLAPFFPFRLLLVKNEITRNFLQGAGFRGPIEIYAPEDSLSPSPVSEEEWEYARTGYGIPSPETRTTLVIYEVQTEWACRRWLTLRATRQEAGKILVWPENSRAWEIFHSTCGLFLQALDILVVDDLATAEQAADQVVMFRYREDLHAPRRRGVQIMDVGNRFLSLEVLNAAQPVE